MNQTSEAKIHYIVGRNLGHLNRCVANLIRFRKMSRDTVKIYTFSHSHPWLRANLPKGKIRKLPSLRKKAQTLLQANLIMHDWRDEVRCLKSARIGNGPIIGGIYHSDLSTSSAETGWTKKFKEQIKEVAQSSTDIFFHINLNQPKDIPSLSTLYVPIPLIAREITMQPKEVKKCLEIPANEPFILINMGGGVGRYRYRYINEWYEKINRMKTPYRIVVASQLGKMDFSFRNGIVQAPLFNNGRNLVHAADLVISKPGMGILMDCITTGTPLLALPADTKEREVKNMMLRDITGDDLCLATNRQSHEDVARVVEEILKRTRHYRSVFEKVPQNGGDVIAQSMRLLSGVGLKDLPDVYGEISKITPFSVK
jgi:UDP-N-acetylglucosamine transferase subunit ALG13